MKRNRSFSIPLVLLIAFVAGCSDSETGPPPAAASSTFSTIQTEIFAKSCAVSGCHAGATPTGAMSLEAGVAYQNLIDVRPANERAKSEGLFRIRPGVPDSSFLYLKIVGLLKEGHGSRMPLGSNPLPQGTIEFVRQWIAAGAPKTGVVADTALLDDVAQDFVPMAPPAPGEGIQIHLNPFEIAPKSEREIFYFLRATNPAPIAVNGFRVQMRNNSHHFIIYGYSPGSPVLPPAGVYRDQGGDMEEYAVHRQFLAGSQVADFSYNFPEGVAMMVPANAGLDLNSHYVNPTDEKIHGEVYVNLYSIDNPTRLAQSLLSGPFDFRLPPFSTTVVHDTLEDFRSYKNGVDIFLLTSHMHKRGKTFRLYIVGGPNDGQLVYENHDWHLPYVKTFETPLRLNKGQTLRIEATYENNTEFMVGFGLTSEDEMCLAAGYYAGV